MFLSDTTTVLDALLASLEKAGAYNRNIQVAPAVVLWPDHGRQWAPLVPALRAMLPQLLTLGDYDPAARTGPATWIKCMIARTLPEAGWAGDVVPILYLPGVSRLDLRAVESCPKHLQPLAELQYRGVFWTQQNGRDWSVLAFLKGKGGGLGLDVAQDAKTLEAMNRALVQLADTPVASLRGRRLEASDFDHLLTTDPVRDILRWLNDPAGTKDRWGPGVWGAFRSVCKADFGFDPETDGELTGAEKLAGREGKWERVWARFAESPRLYPDLPALLRKVEPGAQLDLFADRSPWPGANDKGEENLRKALLELDGRPSLEACEKVWSLEGQHGERRGWVWAELGLAPLAQALLHLASLADIASEALGGESPAQMGAAYTDKAWRAAPRSGRRWPAWSARPTSPRSRRQCAPSTAPGWRRPQSGCRAWSPSRASPGNRARARPRRSSPPRASACSSRMVCASTSGRRSERNSKRTGWRSPSARAGRGFRR